MTTRLLYESFMQDTLCSKAGVQQEDEDEAEQNHSWLHDDSQAKYPGIFYKRRKINLGQKRALRLQSTAELRTLELAVD